MDRHEHLDGLRGIAALCVVLFHSRGFAIAASRPPEQVGEWSWFGYQLSWFTQGEFAVAVFFVLSGYLLVEKFHRTGDYRLLAESAVKRYFRLTPMLVASLILLLALAAMVGVHADKLGQAMEDSWTRGRHVDPLFWESLRQATIAAYIGPTPYNIVFWTMRFELFGSLMLLGFCAIFMRLRIFPLIAGCASAILIARFGTIGLFYSLFLAGAVLLIIPRTPIPLVAAVIALVLGAQYPWTPLTQAVDPYVPEWLDAQRVLHALGAVLLVSAALSSDILKSFLSSKPLVWLGRVSFGLYVCHLPIMITLGAACVLNLKPIWGLQIASAVGLLLVLITTIVLAEILRRFIDVPSQQYASVIGRAVTRSIVRSALNNETPFNRKANARQLGTSFAHSQAILREIMAHPAPDSREVALRLFNVLKTVAPIKFVNSAVEAEMHDLPGPDRKAL